MNVRVTQSAIRNSRSAMRAMRRRCGFTLVELLVVIGIIILLVGILLPVVNGARRAAWNAASAQQISRLTAAIEAYSQDFRAYPGPLSDEQIIKGAPGLPAVKTPADGVAIPALKGVTMSENLVLGLLGGVAPSTATGPAAAFGEYDEDRIRARTGPMSLNSANPKAYKAYMEASASELSLRGAGAPAGNYRSASGGPQAQDSAIPEFVDHFPDSLPVLYLRARKGASGVISDATTPTKFQYDLRYIQGYTSPKVAVSGRTGQWQTGIGGTPTPAGAGFPGGHGIQALGSPLLITNPNVKPAQEPWGSEGSNGSTGPPYGAITYFMHPQLTPAGTAPTNATATPRQKDTYILISAGKDRVYGTRDDVTNFGSLD